MQLEVFGGAGNFCGWT